jgi:uncharacterized protein
MDASDKFQVQHSIGLSILLHLFPGLVLLLGFILVGPIIASYGLPSLLAIIVIDALIVLPLMIGILYCSGRKSGTRKVRVPVIAYRESVRWPLFVLLVVVTLAWAILTFVLLNPISEALRTTLFFWLPAWFELGHYVASPESYTFGSVLITWLLAFGITSIAAPIVEELYFRGYLLPRIDRYGRWAPFINVVLFALCHFWSLWFVPTRIVALLPLVYVVWFKRCIYVAIVVHVLLNVVGDSVLTIPAVFGREIPR